MSGTLVSVLLWLVVVVGYACSVRSLGKVWREQPGEEAVARPSAPRLASSRGGTGRPRQVPDRRPQRVGRLRGSRLISAK